MADNVAVTPGTGATIATDDVAGVQFQKVKIDLGGDGATSPLVRGQQAAASSLPVVLASDQGTVPVSAAALPLPTGAATAALQTQPGVDIGDVTVNNASGAAAVNIQDGGNSITVDGTVAVSGTVTVDSELPSAAALADGAANPTTPMAGAANLMFNGTTWDRARGDTANGLDVDVTRLPALPAGTNNIGDVDVLTLPNVTLAAGTNTNEVVGDAAHDAAIAGNPVRIAGRAGNADYTAVANGDTADLLCDLNGKQIVMPYGVPENFVAGVTAAITGTSNTSVIAAAGVGIRNYITSLLVTNSHASTGTLVELKDGTTVIWRGYAPPGGGFAVHFPVPLRGTANTAINAANVTTGSNTYVSAAGFKGP